ncbi:DUF1080 domain-containing protein [Planctomicrobium sp.]|nr:family 16 glycoside hydrolase [Planctomicrobium sp.]MDA7527817.1 DUF1080 domain-containing protein [bacterium]MDB4733108.1 DUF1080 domain-containing protein [Planctomicrobium sp.]MDB4793189.1 DUF1080 domain-containing protein [bacterium]
MNKFTRRSFLKSSALIAFSGVSYGSSTTTRPNLLGFGTYGLPGYSISDSIQLVAKTGFDSIEIAAMQGYHGAPDQLSKAKRQEVRRALVDSKLRLGALMGLPHPHAGKQKEDNAWVEELLKLALDLSPEDPPLIQSVLGGGKWEEKNTLFRDAIGPWVELAAKAGVTLAIKPHRGHAMSLPEQGIWLIDQLNAFGTLKLVYDHSHYMYRKLPVIESIEKALPYTGYIVVKDATMIDGQVRFELPGEAGSIPHADILKQFIDGGYRGEICCEVSSQVWKQDGYKPSSATQTCYTNLTAIVNSLDESNFVPIFNGKNLDGWDAQPASWEVRDGEMRCTGTSKNKNWLIWRGAQPANFVLRLDFRWEKGNSGVQVRSDDLGDWQVSGYQVEIAQQEKMGLWHHSLLANNHPKKTDRHFMAEAGESVHISNAGKKSVKRILDANSVQENYRQNNWNRMEIIAQGNKLVQKINGVQFATIEDLDAEMSRSNGVIALQDHGKGCRVAFRNIRICID